MLQCRQMGTWMGKQLAGWSSLEVVADATLQLDASSMCGAVGSDQGSVLFVFFIRLLRCSDDPTPRSAVSVLQSRAFTWRHPGRLGKEYEIQQRQTYKPSSGKGILCDRLSMTGCWSRCGQMGSGVSSCGVHWSEDDRQHQGQELEGRDCPLRWHSWIYRGNSAVLGPQHKEAMGIS